LRYARDQAKNCGTDDSSSEHDVLFFDKDNSYLILRSVLENMQEFVRERERERERTRERERKSARERENETIRLTEKDGSAKLVSMFIRSLVEIPAN